MSKEKISLYDFDGTIYKGHSSIDFFAFCIARYPKILKYVPKNLVDLYKIKKHILNLQYSRTNYCEFLKDIEDIDSLVEEFWKLHRHKIKPWYLERKKENDVIITASPLFLVKYICDDLGIHNLIASDIDKKTGNLVGSYCFNGEKIKIFNHAYPDAEVEECYTDNVVHDAPLLSLAKNKYQVIGEKVVKL